MGSSLLSLFLFLENKKMSVDYEVIVIGSGAGGLTAAVALAQAGKKVLVCEQHEVPGGWTQSFTLQGYRFSPGVHYIGGLGPGGPMRRIYEGLGVSQDMEFCEINPDGYDHFLFGDQRFDFPKGKENLAARLKERFPQEAKGIDGYLNAVSELMKNLSDLGRVHGVIDGLKNVAKVASVIRWLRRSGQDLIDQYVSDPLLKAILSGQSGDHGLPPSKVSAFIHAGITNHYFDGAYYPRGGAYVIPRAFVRSLKRAGGELRLKTAVQRILLKDKKVTGVQLADGTKLSAEVVISNADPEITFGKLMGREYLSEKLIRKLDKAVYSTSALCLFFAVEGDLRAMGLDSGNYWLYDHEDVNAIYEGGLKNAALSAESPAGMFLTVTTLKDPSKMKKGVHTCEAFAFAGYKAFGKWSHEKQGSRSAEYEALKEDLAGRMLRGIDKRFPELEEKVVFKNLATPLTNAYYLNATAGNLYGLEKSPSQIGPGAFPVQSEIPGLYMCGASTESHGVAGVTASGLSAAQKILGCKRADLLQQKGPELQIYPSEDLSRWPESLPES